jgi:hypothetical protein
MGSAANFEGTHLHGHELHFFLNGVKHTTNEHQLVPEQILQIGGFTSEEYKLVKAHKPNEELVPGVPVEIENGEKFLALKKTNQFSDLKEMSEIEIFVTDKLGLKTENITGSNGVNLVIKDVLIPSGSLSGKLCDVAIAATNSIPFTPHSYFHIRPALVANGPANGTQAGQITPEWQYWSRKWPTPPKRPEDMWAWILTALIEAA